MLAAFFAAAGCGDDQQIQTAGSSALGTQTQETGGVTVKATPQNLGEPGSEWAFQVVMDTHSGDLSQDLVQVSTMIADGKEYAPLSWEGAPPGGHHREGVLKFPAAAPRSRSVELVIREDGAAGWNFTWTLE
jgi:hypothetical protein